MGHGDMAPWCLGGKRTSSDERAHGCLYCVARGGANGLSGEGLPIDLGVDLLGATRVHRHPDRIFLTPQLA
jgi:hypothetical protein